MLEGYSLTTYFMAKAHGRNKRNKIISIIQEDNIIQGDHNWLLYATDFKKQISGCGDDIIISFTGKRIFYLACEDKKVTCIVMLHANIVS
jgi:hypothetical protein